MQADPMEEWRRLTTLYGEMGEVEIRELAGQINDLTPTAQQILRDEMRKRRMTDERPPSPSFASLSPQFVRDNRTLSHFVPESGETEQPLGEADDNRPLDFSWK